MSHIKSRGKISTLFVMKKRSTKKVKSLEDVVLPFKITFPVSIEGSINNNFFNYPKGQEVTLTPEIYENLVNSQYAKYLL